MKGTILKGGYAPITSITSDEVTYDAVVWLESTESGGREYNFSSKGEVKEIYADGKVVFAKKNNHGYDGTITLIDIIDTVAQDWYGDKIGTNGERVEVADNVDIPKFAWIQVEETSDGGEVTTIYPYVFTTKRPDRKGKTSEGNDFDYEFPQHSVAIRPRPTDKIVCWTIDGGEEFDEVPAAPTVSEEVKKN